MVKRKLFVPNESNPIMNSSMAEQTTPSTSGIYPAAGNSPEHGVRQDNRIMETTPEKTMTKTRPDSGANAGDSDSDSMEVPGFFSSSNQKLPYTKQEDELILKYVLKGQNIFKVSSILLWKHLEAKKENPKRTYQSLKNRFLRNIKPNMFSKYMYLIKDKETKDKILSKFPELKQQVGRRETLPRLKLPEIKSPSRDADDGVSSTSTNESQVSGESISPLPKPDNSKSHSKHKSNAAVHREPTQSEKFQVEYESLASVFYKPVAHERATKTNGDGIIVRVDFKPGRRVEKSPGIYERFQSLREKNKLVLCPTCGRCNLPKQATPTKSSEETDVFVQNSVETPKSESKNSKRIGLTSELKSSQTSDRRRMNSTTEPIVQNPSSPSLLTNNNEVRQIDKCVRENHESAQLVVSNSRVSGKGIADKAIESSQTAKSSNSLNPKKKVKNTGGTNAVATQKKKLVSQSKPNKKENTTRAKRSRDSDTDFDSICEDAMANFRKLVDYEEEKQLVRKCLNKNFKSIGLEASSEMNLDSYFLESSSDTEGTPPLTIDFDAESTEKQEQSGSATSSLPSRKLRKRN